MNTRQRVALVAATAALGSGLALAPADTADAVHGPAAAVPASYGTGTREAPGRVSPRITDFSCLLAKRSGWRTCRSGIGVAAGRTISVELVSSGEKKLSVKVAGRTAVLSPDDGYGLSWTNDSSATEKVSIQVKSLLLVDVRANLRYKIG